MAITRSQCVAETLADAGKFLFDVLVHLVEFAGGGGSLPQKNFAQAHRAQRLRKGVAQWPCSLAMISALPPPISTIRMRRWDAASGLDAEMNQAGLFGPGDDLDGGADGERSALHELGLVAGIAHGAGGDGAHTDDVEFLILLGHAGQHIACQFQRFLGQHAVAKHALSQAGDHAFGGQYAHCAVRAGLRPRPCEWSCCRCRSRRSGAYFFLYFSLVQWKLIPDSECLILGNAP